MNNTTNMGVFSIAGRIALLTWYGLTGLAAITGNGAVLWLVTRNRSLRTISNLFLTSLAAADFLVGLVIGPVWISIRETAYNPDNLQTYGRAIDYLWMHTTMATTFNLCCVTLDRHIAIFNPLRYENIVTNRRCYVLIATVWFMSVVLPCGIFLIEGRKILPALWLSCTIITVLIPMIIITFCSIRNFKAAAVQSKKVLTDQSLQTLEAVKKRKKNFKAAKTVSIVVGLFVVCWLPTLVTSFVQYFSKRLTWTKLWAPVEGLAFTSSALNPWVYCLRNDEFNEALTRTFRFLRRRNSVQHHSVARSTNMELTGHNTCNPTV